VTALVVIVKLEVIELLAGGVTGFELKAAVAPVGRPEATERVTAELKLLDDWMVIVEDWDVPV
jgi:hypothetical protein